MPTNNESQTRFDLLEIDGVPADEVQLDGPTRGQIQAMAEAAAEVPAVDPIDAFRLRMEAARDERLALQRAEIEKAAAARAVSDAIVRERSSYVAVEKADETTGAVAFWQLAGSVDLPALRAAMTAESLSDDFTPTAPSSEVALSRACRELAESSILVRKHPLGGWAIVQEIATDDSLTYAEGIRFALDGDKVAAYESSGGVMDQVLAERVQEGFARNLAALSTTDISSWLVKLADGPLDGVALRDRGGVYFVPRDKMEIFRKIKKALSSCSQHVVHEIPALKSSEAIAAVLDAVARHAKGAIAELEGELNDPLGVGTRAAVNRVKEIDILLAKVRGYERLLGRSLAADVAKLEEIRAGFAKTTTNFANLEVE